jgi:hypothetical protein
LERKQRAQGSKNKDVRAGIFVPKRRNGDISIIRRVHKCDHDGILADNQYDCSVWQVCKRRRGNRSA